MIAMTTVRISNSGEHAAPHPFTHVVNNHGLLVDLSGLQHSIVNPDTFVDPSITEVTWGPVSIPDGRGGLRMSEGGTIKRQDGSLRQFFEFALLKPYIAAVQARKKELLGV